MLREGTRPERLAQARAQLEEIEAQFREMQITAPTDSILEILSVKVGDVLAPNREVATLILPSYLWVRVYVPQPWLGHIKLGDEVRARVDSFRGDEFKGIVEQINRQAEFTPRNVQTVEDRIRQVFGVKIRLENRDDKLRAGMSADVVFSKRTRGMNLEARNPGKELKKLSRRLPIAFPSWFPGFQIYIVPAWQIQ
jgi:multidrug resistance efflux pump